MPKTEGVRFDEALPPQSASLTAPPKVEPKYSRLKSNIYNQKDCKPFLSDNLQSYSLFNLLF